MSRNSTECPLGNTALACPARVLISFEVVSGYGLAGHRWVRIGLLVFILACGFELTTAGASDLAMVERRCIEYGYAVDEFPRLLETAYALGGSDPVLVNQYMEWAMADVNVAAYRLMEARNASGLAPRSDDDAKFSSALGAVQRAAERLVSAVSTRNPLATLAAQRDLGEATIALHEVGYEAVCSAAE